MEYTNHTEVLELIIQTLTVKSMRMGTCVWGQEEKHIKNNRLRIFSLQSRDVAMNRLSSVNAAFRATLSLLTLLLIGLSSPVTGEETKPSTLAELETVKQNVTNLDQGISLSHLKLLLRPLNKEELTQELKAWMALLQKHVSNASLVSIKMQDYATPSDIPDELKAKRDDLWAQEYRLYRRIQVVISALKAKGGNTETEEKYLDAIAYDRLKNEEGTFFSLLYSDSKAWLRDPDGGKKFLRGVGKATIFLLLFWIFSKIGSSLIKKIIAKNRRMSVMLGHFIERSVKGTVIVIGLLFALGSLGLQIGPMIAAMSAGGFILGFALQDTLGNFASGMMVMLYRPFDIGHFVEVAETSGRVDRMNLVSTTLLTPDNKELIIPNKKVWGDTIINYNSKKVRRVDLVFGIGYGDDIRKAAAVLKEITEQHDQVLKTPETVIQVGELADSSVNLLCRPWVKSKDYWNVHRELTWIVKERFDKEGISIPFPQRDLHVHHHNQIPEA